MIFFRIPNFKKLNHDQEFSRTPSISVFLKNTSSPPKIFSASNSLRKFICRIIILFGLKKYPKYNFMLSGALWLIQKASTGLFSNDDHSNDHINIDLLPSFTNTLDVHKVQPPIRNFLNVGSFYNIDGETYFFGKFHGPPGTSIQMGKWFHITKSSSSPVKIKALFRFYDNIVENYFYPFAKAVQVIPFHGQSVIINEQKNDRYLVSLYKLKNKGLKRIRTLYVAKDLSEVTVSCIRSVYIKKTNHVVIGGLHRWVIYDMKAQYMVYQHLLLDNMVCDVAYSESLNLLFVCYLKNIVAYEWNIPFDMKKVAYTIVPEREENPTIYMSLYLRGNLMILRDSSAITAWEVTASNFRQLSTINLSTITPVSNTTLEVDVMVIPEKECVLINNLNSNVYEVGFDAPNAIKCEGSGFNAMVAYNEKSNELAAMYKGEFVLLRENPESKQDENGVRT